MDRHVLQVLEDNKHMLTENKKQALHNKHELLTELAYNTPGMLPDRYVFILTNLCNLDCYFCFQMRDLREDRMKTEDWLHLASQLPDYARVTLTGGEPLMFNGFREVFACVAERYDCNVISNGLLLNEELIEFLLSYPAFRCLSISIDNVGNTLRGVKKRSWARAEKMIRHFAERKQEINPDCVLEAKTVVLDENAAELLDIHKYCVEELGCDHHSFQLLKGSPIQHADYMFEFEEITRKSLAPVYSRFETIQHQLNLVRGYNLKTGAVAFLHPGIADLSSESLLPELDYINQAQHFRENYRSCKFPWSSVHINVDGDLFPCMAVRMGNVKETPLTDIINGEPFERFRDLIRREGTVEGCNRCGWIRPVESPVEVSSNSG